MVRRLIVFLVLVDWPAGRLPCLPASRHAPELAEALALEKTRGQARPVAAVAIDRHRLILVEPPGLLRQFGEEDVRRPGDVSTLPLLRGPHVEHLAVVAGKALVQLDDAL